MRNHFVTLLAMLLTGCDPIWDFNENFSIVIETSAMPRDQVAAALTGAINQLGGRVAADGANRISVVEDTDCAMGLAAHTSGLKPSTIQVCTTWRTLGDGTLVPVAAENRVVQYTIAHELGHVLGVRGHLPCSPPTMMADQPSCYPPDLKYTTVDVKAICDGGYARNLSVCG